MRKFSDIQNVIKKDYDYKPNGFMIGDVYNDKDSNQWSGRVISYALLNKINTQETLELFGEHYQDVLNNPNGDNHKNIRALIKNRIESVKFDNDELLLKKKK